MDYLFAKSEFERLLREINELLKKPKVEFQEADPLAKSTAVYIKNLFASKEDDRKAYQKSFDRSEGFSYNSVDRLTNCKRLIELVLVDINQNIRKNGDGEDIVHVDDEGKPLTLKQLIKNFDSLERTNRLMGRIQSETHHLFERSKERVSELNGKLSHAEGDKERLRQEIQRLESKASTNNNNELAKYQESAAKLHNEQVQRDNEQIRKLKDDYQLLQSDIVALRSEKVILEEKLERNKKDSEKEKDTQPLPLTKPVVLERDFYKLFLTSTYVLLSYLWLSVSVKIVGFEVKDNFKYGVAVALLLLYGVLYFSNKDRIKDNIVQFIIGIGAVVLGAFFFYR
jgi:chromosome segregation ATPase